jgi:hypothetical protein
VAKKKKEEPLRMTLNGEEHIVDEMTDEQKMMVNHIADLQNKIDSMRFNLDQVGIGHQAFVNKLEESLADEVVEPEVVVE